MKPSTQSSKSSSSTTKSKKSSKDREKRKSQGGSLEINNHNSTEKGSPTKDSNARLYAGIDADSLTIYAEQNGIEHLTEEITNTLTEDINYRLRYIINDSLIKARLSGKNAISSQDLEQSFENLRIDRVYGAPSHPNWVPFGYQNLFYLDDKIVNLVDIAQEENIYHQYSEAILTNKWIPEQKEVSKALKNYFTTMCQMIVHNDLDVRRMALRNIAENPRIGPIIEWFYNFGYILLSKDITYDCLTLRALDLIRILEFSASCRVNVSERLLKLLVRLILQRLLKSSTNNEVLKPICDVLAILCERTPLRDFVFLKVAQKLDEVFKNYALAVVTIVNSLGTDAVTAIFLPNLELFLSRIDEERESPYTYSILELYRILVKEDLLNSFDIYNAFYQHFGDCLTMFSRRQHTIESESPEKREINVAHVKHDLLKTRRKVTRKCDIRIKPSIEEVFDMPPENSKLRKKIDDSKWETDSRESDVIIGKTSLLLPVFKQRKLRLCLKCHDHTLLAYNF